MTDLEAFEAIEALADTCVCDFTGPYATCPEHGEIEAAEVSFPDYVCPRTGQVVKVDDNCPVCWNGCFSWPYEGAEVTAYGKPGTVRWVTPWNSVAVVFEDGSLHWFFGDDVAEIGEHQ